MKQGLLQEKQTTTTRDRVAPQGMPELQIHFLQYSSGIEPMTRMRICVQEMERPSFLQMQEQSALKEEFYWILFPYYSTPASQSPLHQITFFVGFK